MSSPIASPARNESFQIERRGDLAVITPSPEVENMAENLIEQAAQMVLAPLKADPPGGLIVDLSKVNFFGSVFISFLLRCHLLVKKQGAELVLAGRYRWIIAHDEPPLIGYDQDLWSDGLHHNDDDPGELLSFFGALRRANLDLWKRTSAQERQRVGMHAERGPESLDLSFRLMAGHDRLHLEQTARTVRAVAGRTSG